MSLAEKIAGNESVGYVVIFGGALLALYVIGKKVSDSLPSSADIKDFANSALLQVGEYADSGVDYIYGKTSTPSAAYALPFNIATGLVYVAGSIGEFITDIFRD